MLSSKICFGQAKVEQNPASKLRRQELLVTPKKRKIWHLTFDMRIGGAEQVIATLVQGIDKTRFDVGILCLEKDLGPLGQKLREEGCPILNLDRSPGFDLSLVRQIQQLILSESIAVLHCHQYTPYIYGVLGALGTGCKVIFTEHGRFHPDCRKFKRILLNPLLCRLTASVTAISSATREALVVYENFPRQQIQVIYNGITASRFACPANIMTRESLGIPDDATVLGTVARLDPIKNQPMMLKALKEVLKTQPKTFLLIVGDGPERNTLTELAKALDVTEYVRFTGYQVEVQRYYPLMDIFLLTSFSEGTAMTLLEAMASSLPCIVTNVGGNPEIVLDDVSGFVIASDDAVALAEKITQCQGNEELLNRLGRAGRQRFLENFTSEKMVQSFETLYSR